jgi:hypothetical protein
VVSTAKSSEIDRRHHLAAGGSVFATGAITAQLPLKRDAMGAKGSQTMLTSCSEPIKMKSQGVRTVYSLPIPMSSLILQHRYLSGPFHSAGACVC